MIDAGSFLRHVAPNGGLRTIAGVTDDAGRLRLRNAVGDEWIVATPDDWPTAVDKNARRANAEAQPLSLYIDENAFGQHLATIATLPRSHQFHLVHRDWTPSPL